MGIVHSSTKTPEEAFHKWQIEAIHPDESCQVVAIVYSNNKNGVCVWETGYSWFSKEEIQSEDGEALPIPQSGTVTFSFPDKQEHPNKAWAMTAKEARARAWEEALNMIRLLDIPLPPEWEYWIETGKSEAEE